MNVGRNDPCTCGSGKKYKKCCLDENQTSQDEFKKRRWSAVQTGLIEKILDHASEFYGPHAIHEAYNEFQLFETEDRVKPKSTELPVFMPWFFYEWRPDLENEIFEGAPDMPPAQSLLENDRRLSADEKLHLQKCGETAFSFFEILEIIPEKSLKLKDILTEEHHSVLEKKATQGVQKGDIFFGKVISIDNIDVLEACAPIIIRPEFKIQIIELRQFLQKKHPRLSQDILHIFGIEVLELYRYIYEASVNPKPSTLVNTDGHLLIPHKLTFDIEDPRSTFEALHKLCFSKTKDELLGEAHYDKNHNLVSIEFPWLKKGNKKNKSWENTVLGHINIDRTKMTVDVNSKERAKKFQTELKKRIPTGWKLKSTVIESIESQMKKIKITPKEMAKQEAEQQKMLENPEIRKQMEDSMKSHWDNWLVNSLPALGGLKPVEAVKTKDGREALDALLTQFERRADSNPMVGQTRKTFETIRTKLGL